MKTQMFFRGTKVDFYLEKYERINESKVFEKKLDIVNFELLPLKISISSPREEYLKKNAEFALDGERKKGKLHTGLQKTSYPFLYQGNETLDKSEIRVYFTNNNRSLWVVYFPKFRLFPSQRALLSDTVMQYLGNWIKNHK